MQHKQLTVKEKVEILKSIQNTSIDAEKLANYMQYALVPELTQPVLSKILAYLIDLDTQIGAAYKTIADEEWEQIFTSSQKLGDNFEVKTMIDCLALHFDLLVGIFMKLEPSIALKILSPIFKVRTLNIQFIVFVYAEKYPKQVLGFLLSRVKTAPVIFTPFLVSLLVRLGSGREIKQSCHMAFVKYVETQKPSASPSYLVLLQALVYSGCFKEFSCNVPAGLIERTREENLLGYLNREVVVRFCEKQGLAVPSFQVVKGDLFYFFPFDRPVIPRIAEAISEFYVDFECC